ncbi:hypothetical protein CMV_009752 [Castanea mollissima]|uniref:Uncharacterized protein n=1 Tax=Castanea mollissima TaxID=60419 RepID=A0A8J4RGV2_9ROSI|nr:hypothetical protein CMV_009752 [Castanea mollissima]
MGLNRSSDGSDSDSNEALVVGFFGGVGFDNGGSVSWVWIGVRALMGLKLLDCDLFLFGVKMKENVRRFWVLLLF